MQKPGRMEIKNIDINKLKAAKYNPRQLTNGQKEHIKNSLEKFGVVDPIIVNKNNTIIGGHQRVVVLKEMGVKEVPVYYVDLSEADAKELNVRLNKNTGDWDWDIPQAEFEIEQLTDWGFDKDGMPLMDCFGQAFTLNDDQEKKLETMSFTLASEQAEILRAKIKEIKATDLYKYAETFGNENSNGNALYCLVQDRK